MKKFNATELETIALHMSLLLIAANDSITTLDIKNAIFNVFDTYDLELKQAEVSKAMDNVFHSNPDLLERENKSTNGNFFIYSLKEKTLPVVKDDTAIVSDTASVKITKVSSTPDNLYATASTGKDSAVVGKLINYPNDFLKRLDGHLMISFSKGDNNYFLTNTTDRFAARQLFKKVTSARHNDVRTISVQTYLKRNKLI